MRIIKLNKGYEALLDDEDYDRLYKYTWYVQIKANNKYARTSIYLGGRIKLLSMHVAVMNGRGIDHIDNNGLNNQKNNLRFATNRQNQQNMAGVWGRIPYKGVFYIGARRKYTARIATNGKQKHLGYFFDPKNAAKAYDRAALKYFGEFAKTNAMLGLI